MGMKSVLEENKESVIGYLSARKTNRYIADLYGVHINTVRRFAKRNKVPTSPRKLDQYEDYISSEINRGRAMIDLSSELGCSPATLATKAKELGVSRPNKLDHMKEYITGLYCDKLNCEAISALTGEPSTTIRNSLAAWGVKLRKSKSKSEALAAISLNDLKSNWVDINQPSVVTVGRIPKFYLVPIN